MPSTILVIGGGAIGTFVTVRLALSAQPVALLARPGSVQAIAAHGLHLAHNGEHHTMEHVPVVAEPSELRGDYQNPDLAILCVKGFATPGAVPVLAALQPRMVLTLQNGIGNEEVLAAHFGADRVLAGIITSSVEVDAPGQVTVTKAGGVGVAPLNYGSDTTRWSNLLRSGGFAVYDYQDYRAMKWSKALLNMLGNATSAILDMSVEEVYGDWRMVALERRAFREGLMVMRHLGIGPINLPRYPAALLATAMERMPLPVLWPVLRQAIAGGRGGKLPSLHMDLRQGRRQSENDHLYGAIARTACEMGVSAPVNAALWYVLDGIVAGSLPWDYFRGQPARLLDMVGR